MKNDLPVLTEGTDYLAVTAAVRVDQPATPEAIADVRKTFADAAERAFLSRIGQTAA